MAVEPETKSVAMMDGQRPESLSGDEGCVAPVKRPWWHAIKEPGSALQIVIAALLAIAIGLIVTTQVNNVPQAAVVILSIPGDLWLRALRAVGELPLFLPLLYNRIINTM